jgi:hypothetical protein
VTLGKGQVTASPFGMALVPSPTIVANPASPTASPIRCRQMWTTK